MPLGRPSVAGVREPPVIPPAVLAAAVILGCVIVVSAVLVIVGAVGLSAPAGQKARVTTVPTPGEPPGASLLWIPPSPAPVTRGRHGK